ncbi:MAG: HAD-IC family P-type ATPase, partial [Deltaproteobacteria bacterium]|nr:HAD-IC family P-type ATPase [Deltaproteobacteria bacterium]
MMECYNQPAHEVLKQLITSEEGLTSPEAAKRLARYGKNILKEGEKVSPFRVLLEQFNSPVVWILIGALIVSFVIGERIDAIVIAAILILNAIIGFFQEYRAEREIEALKQLASHKAVVRRDGKETEIDASGVVPGDIVLLKEGDKVPADARVIKALQTQTQESMLTGESLPVMKTSQALSGDKETAEQTNMLFSGTEITRGKASAVVVRTGMNSEIGKIAKLIQETKKEQTPLQEKLARMGGMLSVITIAICALVLLTGLLKGEEFLEIFTISVALAVAAIPEGLPAVVTISLAVGVRRMLGRNALIRRLPSVETLGSTTVICSDKTGTLTHNEMTVKKIFANDKVIDVTGSGYNSTGGFSEEPTEFSLLLEIGVLCNDAKIEQKQCIGDPTEGSLIVTAIKAGIGTEELNEDFPRLNEIPFSSERKRMTTIHKIGEKYLAYMKGAPDILLDLCSGYYSDKEISSLTEERKQVILQSNREFSENALRVIGFGFKEINDPLGFTEGDERDFVFVGLQAMIDPPREEVKTAISQCHEAGIKV